MIPCNLTSSVYSQIGWLYKAFPRKDDPGPKVSRTPLPVKARLCSVFRQPIDREGGKPGRTRNYRVPTSEQQTVLKTIDTLLKGLRSQLVTRDCGCVTFVFTVVSVRGGVEGLAASGIMQA
jgi:hypothetical protein